MTEKLRESIWSTDKINANLKDFSNEERRKKLQSPHLGQRRLVNYVFYKCVRGKEKVDIA